MTQHPPLVRQGLACAGWLRLLLLSVLILPARWAGVWSQSLLSGHAIDAASMDPIVGAWVVAYPCQEHVFTDGNGHFVVECAVALDSIAVHAIGYPVVVRLVPKDGHLDLALVPLAVDLVEVEVSASAAPEREAVALPKGDFMDVLNATPGLASMDLGAGLVQPVVRGLFGSRVAILEDGVPQQGARWGADHGALMDPDLYAASAWVPGAGQIQFGPESQAGGLRFQSALWTGETARTTATGLTARSGDFGLKAYALHTRSDSTGLFQAGGSWSVFGDRNVPQSQFSYLGRTYALPEGRLVNTAGRAGHAVVQSEQPRTGSGTFKWVVRAGDVRQGLFPGIVGIPREGDLAPDGERHDVALPMQHASRLLATFKWTRLPDGQPEFRAHTASFAWHRRLELAPPHAHGWGPEPTSPISLELQEWTAFAEGLKKDAHGQVGWQVEALALQATGWEFLVPDHRRLRVSSWWSNGTWSARFDGVVAAQNAHAEPLYNAEGTVIGTDVRSLARTWWVPGGALSYERPFTLGAGTSGQLTASASTRAPSNYEWGAFGIHHGTFRFEQGNPDLKPEQTLEGRFNLDSRAHQDALSIHIQGFAALHRQFIHLAPSAAFAPIVHAGQVYAFRAVNAFRSGAEASLAWRSGPSRWTLDASALGQWELATGLGLPFTTPLQARFGWEHAPPSQKWSVAGGVKGVAPAWVVARNEATTPGTVLFDARVQWRGRHGVWIVKGHNLLNAAWLDHSSSYRALGMVAQGRWISCSYQLKINH